MASKRIAHFAGAVRGAGAGIVLAFWAAAAGAQLADLERAIRGQLPGDARRAMRDAQKLNERAQTGAECDRLKQWIGSVPATGATSHGARPEQLLPFVEDALFARHFGKTYPELTVADFRNAQVAQRECHRSGIFTPAEQQLVGQIWNQHQHARLSQLLEANRGKRQQASGLLGELDTLQARPEDLRRLDAIRAEAASLSRSMNANEQAALATKVAQTRERIGPPVMKQRVAEQIANARDGAGLASLAALDAELAGSALGRQHTDPLREQLKAHIGRLDASVAATERSGSPLVSTTAGLGAVEESKRWLGEFDRRFQAVLPAAPALDELRRQVLAKREGQLAQAVPVLTAQVRAAPNAQEASALLGRYLSTQEQQSGVGRSIKQASDERIASLDRATRNEAVFGAQPGQPSGKVAATGEPPANQPAAVARCDALAADPQDPTRTTDGVADEDLVAATALAACNEAVAQAPGNARVRFQQGRALLKAGRLKEAVAAFQQAAQANQPGALAYLATAHEHGAGGVAKSQSKSDELFAKAQSLGYGTGSAPRTAAARTPGNAQAGSVAGNYEVPDLVKAIYTADASLLKENLIFTGKYLLSQAEILAGECKTFKLSEVRAFQDNLARKVMPKSSNEATSMAAGNLMDTLKVLAEAQRNPQVMVEMGRAEQRLDDAPAYGANDLVEFTKNHGGCGSAPLDRYSRNLRAYFERLNAR